MKNLFNNLLLNSRFVFQNAGADKPQPTVEASTTEKPDDFLKFLENQPPLEQVLAKANEGKEKTTSEAKRLTKLTIEQEVELANLEKEAAKHENVSRIKFKDEVVKGDIVDSLALQMREGTDRTQDVVALALEDGRTLEQNVLVALNSKEVQKVLGKKAVAQIKEDFNEANGIMKGKIAEHATDPSMLKMYTEKYTEFNKEMDKHAKKAVGEGAGAEISRGYLKVMASSYLQVNRPTA